MTSTTTTTTVNLTPIPAPGLVVFPGFTATKQERFIVKQCSEWKTDNRFKVHFATPTNEPGAPFLEINELQRNKLIAFTTPDGNEVMRIQKEPHKWSGKDPEYHGITPHGQEAWYLKLHMGLRGTTYSKWTGTLFFSSLPSIWSACPLMLTMVKFADLTVHSSPQNVHTEKKILGQDMAIMVNNCPAATMTRHEYWSHAHRQDLVLVAPGMDILLALGLNWIHVDKQAMDAKVAVAVAT